jgi:hypothetical protein
VSLDERYGRRPAANGRRLLVAGLAVFVLAAAVWAVWSVAVLNRDALSWRPPRVDASDPAVVRLSFEVGGGRPGPVVCAVRATDGDGRVVGWADVPAQAGPESTVTAAVRTSRPAADGSVVSCVRR